MIQYPTIMVAQVQNGVLIFSTISPPFTVNKGHTVSGNIWINSPMSIKCKGEMILVCGKEQIKTPFEFDVDNVEPEEKIFCNYVTEKDTSCIKIVFALGFQQSLFMPKGSQPTISIDNLWLAVQP